MLDKLIAVTFLCVIIPILLVKIFFHSEKNAASKITLKVLAIEATVIISLITISLWSTFLCKWWNEGSWKVTSCSIKGIEGFAGAGYWIFLISAFLVFIPLIIFFFGQVWIFSFWITQIKTSFKNPFENNILTWIDKSLSIIWLLILISGFLIPLILKLISLI